jgi:hypothetical protein
MEKRMKRRTWRPGFGLPLLCLVSLSTGACHHVIIDGGLEPTERRFDEEWNLAFAAAIYPADVDARGMCGGNYATVETRQSFLNFIVAAWTVGWITPMEARMECGDPASRVGGPEPDGAPEHLTEQDAAQERFTETNRSRAGGDDGR